MIAKLITRLGRFGTTIIALAIVQTLILGWMVADRIVLLRSDNIVTLKSEPVDPRDIFRGDYVILAYGISTLAPSQIKGDANWKDNEPVFVEITPSEDTWRAVAAYAHVVTPELGNKIIRGQIQYYDDQNDTARIDYGIERYYVPEGEGRTLEDQRNKSALSVDVVLANDGEAAIKRLRIDGEPIYEEPLF